MKMIKLVAATVALGLLSQADACWNSNNSCWNSTEGRIAQKLAAQDQGYIELFVCLTPREQAQQLQGMGYNTQKNILNLARHERCVVSEAQGYINGMHVKGYWDDGYFILGGHDHDTGFRKALMNYVYQMQDNLEGHQ